MALSDPQSVTVNAVARSLPRILTGTPIGTFVTADGVTTLTVDPSGTKARKISKAAIRENVNVTDAVTGLVSVQNHSFTIIANRPKTGISDTVAEQLASGLIAWATAGSNANLKKLLAGEN